MGAVFLKLLNMSITAGWVVLAVVMLRLVFRKMPKAIRCILWTLVAIRLICPLSIESDISLVPSAETIPQNNLYSNEPSINSGIYMLNSAVNPILSGDSANNGELHSEESNQGNIVAQAVNIASYIWVTGVAIILIYATSSYVYIRRKVQASVKLQDNIYICDDIDTPFILGIIRPRIYLPSYLSERERECVVAHEQAHIKRRDHWWKPLGFLLLMVYWFNPLMWVAYVLLCRDIELACDERVIRDMGSVEKKEYSEVLLSCGTCHKMVMVTPLAFGEVAVKSRIKSVLSYKKPGFWVIVVAAIICVVFAVVFLTNPIKGDRAEDDNSMQVKGNIIETYHCTYEVAGIKSIAYLWLDHEEKICGFAPSIAMSYMADGKFVIENNKLIVISSLGDTYTFRILADALEYQGHNGAYNELGKIKRGEQFELVDVTYKSDVYEEENSFIEDETSEVVENVDAPVPDGAVFELFAEANN